MTSSIDQQFIEYVVKSLVSNPDKVSIKRTIDEKGVLLELTVDPEDLGRVIGKRGATAQSLRTLLRALGTKNDARYNLKIIDNGDGPTRRPEPSQDTEKAETKDEPEQEDKKPTDDKVEEPIEDVVEDEPVKDDEHSDVVSKTRAELDELDDLDI